MLEKHVPDYLLQAMENYKEILAYVINLQIAAGNPEHCQRNLTLLRKFTLQAC